MHDHLELHTHNSENNMKETVTVYGLKINEIKAVLQLLIIIVCIAALLEICLLSMYHCFIGMGRSTAIRSPPETGKHDCRN